MLRNWSLLGECFSLLILVIIFLRYYFFGIRAVLTPKKKLFCYCLLSAGASILLNILTVFTLSGPAGVPQWLNTLLNSGYFLLTGGTCTLFALFLFRLTLEHVYDPHCTRMSSTMLAVLFSLFVLAVLVNLRTGILFYFDAEGHYQQGPLNRAVLLLPLLQLVFLLFCYFRNRSSVSTSMVYVMRMLPSVVVLVCLFQLLYPDMLLNGILSAFVSLILFLSFQTYTEDQDSLTGIRNRSSFMAELSQRISRRQSMQIIVVSLLSFSDVNLRYGHQTGDDVLYEVASYLDRLSPKGLAFRTANTTFTLLLPQADQAQMEARVQAVQARFQKPWVLGSVSCHLPSVMAVLCCGDGADSSSEVLEQLEYTQRLAKNQLDTVWFDASVKRRMQRQRELVALMRRSIQEHRFRVWYQPIFCCHGGGFCSAEALLRLNDDSGAPVSPDEFIPLAEETGMIGDLTWIVLEEVCRLLSSGQAPGLNSISVNLSMQQLQDPDLTERICRYLDQYGLSPEHLKVEITERFLLHDAQYARRQLSTLAAAGIQICMDDFGTGYSNLSSVLDFPFAFIKLDRSLILHALEDSRADLMVRTLLSLFHSLDKRVVVEGAETQAQADYLDQNGADMIQGFYYAKPMPSETLLSFLREHPQQP